MAKKEIANQLVKDLGKILTLPDLELNEQNFCALLFDGDILLNVEYDDVNEQMMLYVFLDEIPDTGSEKILRTLLAANFFWYRTNGATLSLEEETGGIILTYAHPLFDLDIGSFENICEKFVQTAEEWKNRLAEVKKESESDSDTASGVTDDGFRTDGLIRV